jgi:Na+-driven multidrug efflux pump
MHIADSALFGLTMSTSVIVGQCLEAENPKRAREVAFKSALLNFFLIAAVAAVIYPFRRAIVEVFADNPEIIFKTEQFLQILLPSLPFFGCL